MALRRRIGDSRFITAAGAYQTWWRDENDKIIWATVPTIEAAKELRDKKRRERRKIVETPKVIRDIQRMAELLDTTPERDVFTQAVADHDETYDPCGDRCPPRHPRWATWRWG